MGKRKLPDRPKPPNLEQIVADLHRAEDDDMVFQIDKVPEEDGFSFSTLNSPSGGTNLSDLSASTLESQISLASIDNNSLGQSENDTFTQEMEKSYNQVKRLIQLYSVIKMEPEELNNKLTKLETLGEEITDSILDLRQAAEALTKT
ncbi:hypothetical protein CHS0354_033507 [Potamilus streckersoni]|uniref:Uncharacterized protein n=1 Tax=Potamilus streckersoni TaxID=2493646 RepID=A0AAE0VTK3_9BIVA|nr:hypothetical protein CHS0354_033507 [Potamilus streckersoni]